MRKNYLESHRQYNLILDFMQDIQTKKKLLEVGAAEMGLKDLLPKNVIYYSLDFGVENNPALEGLEYTYLFNLNDGALPIADKTYDYVVCFETLEHVLYPERVLKEIIRVTKDDGIIFISMPNEYNFIQRIYYLFAVKRFCDEPFQVVEKSLHIHRPRVQDIINLVGSHLEIVEVDYFFQSAKFPHFIDNIINGLAKLFPSLFARVVAIKAVKR